MKKIVPSMVDKRVNKIEKKLIPLYVAEGLLLDMQKTQTKIVALVVEAINFEKPTHIVSPYQIDVVHTRGHEDHHDDARSEGKSNGKRQKNI
ncbi:hypothetical protein Tco_1560093 [Tanacetum coccineum]